MKKNTNRNITTYRFTFIDKKKQSNFHGNMSTPSFLNKLYEALKTDLFRHSSSLAHPMKSGCSNFFKSVNVIERKSCWKRVLNRIDL